MQLSGQHSACLFFFFCSSLCSHEVPHCLVLSRIPLSAASSYNPPTMRCRGSTAAAGAALFCAALLLAQLILRPPPTLRTLPPAQRVFFPWTPQPQLSLPPALAAAIEWSPTFLLAPAFRAAAPRLAGSAAAEAAAAAAAAAVAAFSRSPPAALNLSAALALPGVALVAKVLPPAGAGELVAPWRAMPATLRALCAAGVAFEDLAPRGCGGDLPPAPPPPAFRAPWCTRPDAPLHVAGGGGGGAALLESFVGDDAAGPEWRVDAGNALALSANGAMFALNEGALRPFLLAPRGAAAPLGVPPAAAHALLASIGPTRCQWCPGHFVNEALPQLLLLDALLPPFVPLLWPGGEFPEALLAALRGGGAGALASLRARPIVVEPREPLLHVARDALLVLREGGASWVAQRWANGLLRQLSGGAPPPGAPRPLRVVLLQREGASSRVLGNTEAVLNAVAEELRGAAGGLEVHAFTPGSGAGTGFLEGGAHVAAADIVLGVHGANLANIIFLGQGAWVLELGMPDMFSCYMCLARAVGATYWVAVGAGRHGEREHEANVGEVREILRVFREEHAERFA